jgi:glycosyltransferase 2 family protein
MTIKPKAAAPTAASTNTVTILEPFPPLPPKRKVRRYLFVLILLGLTIYFVLTRFVAMERSVLAISNLKISFVLLSVVAQLLSYAGSGYLLRKVVSLAAKPVSILDGAFMTAGANSVGTLGGGVIGTAGMTYFWLRRRGANPGAAGLGGWLPIILNNTLLALASLAGLLAMIHLNKFPRVFATGFALAFLILGTFTAVLIWSVTHRERMEPVANAISDFVSKFRRQPSEHSKIGAAVRHFFEEWDALLKSGWHGPTVGAILNTGFDMLTLAFLFLAAGYRVSLVVLIAGYAVPQLLGKLTIVLGGVGVVEAGMIGLYSVLGIPRKSGVIVVLAYRLLSFWLPTLIGIFLIPYLDRRNATPSGTENAAESTR